MENSTENMYANNREYDDDRSLGSRSMDISTSNHGRQVGTQDQFENGLTADDGANQGGNSPDDNHHSDNHSHIAPENAITAEAENCVSKERIQLYKDNQRRLTSILDNIKHSTQTVLSEMSIYLKESEEIEKTYIRCRANTQKESQRLEQVEPDVAGATQRFQAQGQAMFAAGDFMNMAALMSGGGAMQSVPGGNGASSGGLDA